MATRDQVQPGVPPRPQAAVAEKHKLSNFARSQRVWGFIFLSPWIIGFLAFTIIPLVSGLVFSTLYFKLNQPDQIRFVGLDNYEQLTTDPILKTSAMVTLRFAAIALPIAIFLPIGLASLMNSKRLAAKPFFRTLFYMPYIVPLVSAVYIWQGMLNSETGWINRILLEIGISGPEWLNSQTWIYPALVVIGLWGTGNAFLITLAGMQTVPTELYEAATVDGAGPFRRFFSITLPMISPIIFYNLVLSVIGIFRYFEIPFILSEGTGRPGNSTLFYNLHFYKTVFQQFDMGYGSSIAWLLFAATLVVTLFLFGTSRFWVYYAGGEED
jgi:multiple sugar transport system permease protein